METAYLNEFLVMSELCNYTAAANALSVSQPTLYRHIKTLEAELGVLLFERKGKKIVLSRFGEMLIPHARRILTETDEYGKKLEAEAAGRSDTLRVFSNYYINDLACRFFEENRKYKILSVINESLERGFDMQDCELAVLCSPVPPDDSCESIFYREDEVVAVVNSSHRLARRTSVRLDELRDEDFVMLFSAVSDFITPSFWIARVYDFFQPKAAVKARYGSQAAQMVAQGFGITLLFRRAIEDAHIDNLALISLDPPVRCPVYLYWKKDSKLSDGAKKLIEFVRKQHQLL